MDSSPRPGSDGWRDPRLLLVAHGTASAVGVRTTGALVEALRAARPAHEVDFCFLDVAEPRLAQALDDRPTILVPVLLSTGYHVQTDIPAIVAGRPNVRIARHLGPHRLLVDALVDRLDAAVNGTRETSATGGVGAATPSARPLHRVLLAGAGSSRSQAADELRATADLLATRLDAEVSVATMSDDLAGAVAGADAVATYLLAPGQFVETLRRAAAATPAGVPVSEPIGVHPALVELVWQRYDGVRNCAVGSG